MYACVCVCMPTLLVISVIARVTARPDVTIFVKKYQQAIQIANGFLMT